MKSNGLQNSEPLSTVANDSAPLKEVRAARRWMPSFDVKITDREAVVLIDLPGVDEDDLGIEVLPGSILVRGERPFDHDQEDAEEYTSLGRPYGPFLVQTDLSCDVDPNRATAKYRRGVLRVRVPIARQPFEGRSVHP